MRGGLREAAAALALTGLIALTAAAPASGARAQPTTASGPAPGEPAWEVTTLRPTEALRPLAGRVARQLRRRSGAQVEVGPPPPEVLEAVPGGSLAMAEEDGGLRLVLAGDAGRVASAVLVLSGEGEADVRAVALAVESLQDQLAEPARARPDPGTTVEAGGTTWTIVDPGAVTRARGPARPGATPTVYASVFLGVSALEPQLLVGPSVGGGLCARAGAICVVLEAYAPLVPYERSIQGDTIRYRPADMVARLVFRPLHRGPVWVGGSAGFLTRIGRARVPSTGESDWGSSLGLRVTAETIYRFAPPFECVLELGVDAMLDRARFIRGTPVPPPITVPLDETWGLWATLALRVRI